MEQLSFQLFLKPNIVLSMICKGMVRNSDVPLLYHIGKLDNLKMFELFVDCLFHFSQTYLESDDNNNGNNKQNKSFLKRYLNFNHCNFPIIIWLEFVKFWECTVVYCSVL